MKKKQWKGNYTGKNEASPELMKAFEVLLKEPEKKKPMPYEKRNMHLRDYVLELEKRFGITMFSKVQITQNIHSAQIGLTIQIDDNDCLPEILKKLDEMGLITKKVGFKT